MKSLDYLREILVKAEKMDEDTMEFLDYLTDEECNQLGELLAEVQSRIFKELKFAETKILQSK